MPGRTTIFREIGTLLCVLAPKVRIAVNTFCLLSSLPDAVSIEPAPYPLRCPTNAEAKQQAVHFTDKARVSCSFGFEDLMVVVTL
jgi:hypothetical protein